MIVGQKQPQSLKYDFNVCQNDLHVYHVFYSTVSGFNNNETLQVYRRRQWPTLSAVVL